MLDTKEKILVTGATGYIGGRLIPELLESGAAVRVLARDARRLESRAWRKKVEIFEGDVFDFESLSKALDGVSRAYYFIHSMNSHSDGFSERDIKAARNFGKASSERSVKQIVYLGGLGDPEDQLSDHLQSRQDTGQALAEYGVPVTELRAAIIVGSGSVSFEMIRYLTERLPIMICPQWVFTKVQPIGIRDVIDYLISALANKNALGKIIEIGGQDVMSYGDMMKIYADIRGLRRILIPVPVLTPRLSSYWVHWFSPIPASITRPLVEGLRNEVVVRDPSAKEIFPEIRPGNYRDAVKSALRNMDAGIMESRWSDALSSSKGDDRPVVLANVEGMIIERRKIKSSSTPENIFRVFSGLGGEKGWLFFNWAWRLRGAIDRLFGGVGLRRGRRNAIDLRLGDALDFWRVEAIDPGKSIRLRAEMKVPGSAWLQFEANAINEGTSEFIQTAYFAPKGFFGILYWYGLYPLHAIIFSGMARNIVKKAQLSDSQQK